MKNFSILKSFCSLSSTFTKQVNFSSIQTKDKLFSNSKFFNKKSNKIGLFLDPCDVDMNDHFFRDDHGNIFAKETSAEAQFMMKELALNQRRYGLIWQLEQLQLKLEEITFLLDKHLNLDTKEELILLRLYKETSSMFQKYFKYLGTEL